MSRGPKTWCRNVEENSTGSSDLQSVLTESDRKFTLPIAGAGFELNHVGKKFAERERFEIVSNRKKKTRQGLAYRVLWL